MAAKQGIDWQDFQGVNLAYVLEQYERYKTSPDSVDPAFKAFFQNSDPPRPSLTAPQPARHPPINAIEKAVAVANLAQSIRFFGHLSAQLDPLGNPPPGDPSLSLEFHNLNEEDLRGFPAALVVENLLDGLPVVDRAGAEDAYTAIEFLRSIYCRTVGYDYGHIFVPKERAWLREAAETRRFYTANDADLSNELLKTVDAMLTFAVSMFDFDSHSSVNGSLCRRHAC